jgi:hypothetical protein
MAEFEAFPKIARLNRDIVITEKIDGTNAAVVITELGQAAGPDIPLAGGDRVVDGVVYSVQAQSRKRIIVPGDDNFGFARWVYDNAEELVRLMGPGRHFGEWWGSGIQRGYGLQKGEKRFSVFNPTFHWGLATPESPLRWSEQVNTVPVLYEGPFQQGRINGCLADLAFRGSVAAPGFMDPEGIVIWHEAARQLFKVTIKGDEKPKGSTE